MVRERFNHIRDRLEALFNSDDALERLAGLLGKLAVELTIAGLAWGFLFAIGAGTLRLLNAVPGFVTTFTPTASLVSYGLIAGMVFCTFIRRDDGSS